MEARLSQRDARRHILAELCRSTFNIVSLNCDLTVSKSQVLSRKKKMETNCAVFSNMVKVPALFLSENLNGNP